jgi:hypothetical protein
MRTKTLLLAVAALATGIVSSEAQNVYSANIVGYVNVVEPAGQFVLQANPLTTGNDVLTNVIKGATGASQIDVWNGAGFTAYSYSTLSHNWTAGAVNADNTPLPPGVGFFIKAGATPFTNTYVGSIIVNSGSNVTNALTAGVLAPVGSLIPFADVVTNASSIDLTVAGASTLQQWSVSAQSFTLYQYNNLSHSWKIGATVTNPVVGAAEGFFLTPSSSTNWVQTSP